MNVLVKLNPYAKTARRMALLAEAERVKARKEKLGKKRSPLSKVMIKAPPLQNYLPYPPTHTKTPTPAISTCSKCKAGAALAMATRSRGTSISSLLGKSSHLKQRGFTAVRRSAKGWSDQRKERMCGSLCQLCRKHIKCKPYLHSSERKCMAPSVEHLIVSQGDELLSFVASF